RFSPYGHATRKRRPHMKHRFLTSMSVLGVVSAMVWMAAGVALAQGSQAPAAGKAKGAPSRYVAPRTADGHPDLQGVWANNNATPLERPAALAGKAFLTDAEVAALKAKSAELFSGDGDAAFGDDVFLA